MGYYHCGIYSSTYAKFKLVLITTFSKINALIYVRTIATKILILIDVQSYISLWDMLGILSLWDKLVLIATFSKMNALIYVRMIATEILTLIDVHSYISLWDILGMLSLRDILFDACKV